MQFAGTREFPQAREQVWSRLRDAAFLANCIPDAAVRGEPTRDEARCTVRPGLAFVRGSLDITLRIADARESESLKYLVHSKGIGSSSEVEATVTLQGHGEGTQVTWTAEVKSLGGLLKAAPTGLIRGAGQKVIDDLWTSVADALGEQPATPPDS